MNNEIAGGLGLKMAEALFEEKLQNTQFTQDAATITEPEPSPTTWQVVKPTTTTGSAQTSPPPPMRDAATEPMEPTPEPILKTYAEIAVQAPTASSAKGKALAVVRHTTTGFFFL